MTKIGIDIEARSGKAEAEISSFAKKVAVEFQRIHKLTNLETAALTQLIAKKRTLVVTDAELLQAKKAAAAGTVKGIKLTKAELATKAKLIAARQREIGRIKQWQRTAAQELKTRKTLVATINRQTQAAKAIRAATARNIAAKKREIHRIEQWQKSTQGSNIAITKQAGLFARVNKHVFRYRMALISVMVAAYALNRIITAAWNFTYVGAQINEQMESLHRLAVRYGTTANKLIAAMKRVSKETLSNAEIAKTAGRAMIMGISAATSVKLMKIATAAARVMGKTTSEMFADITLGTARMSKKILDNIGIIVDWRTAYKKHAAELGISTKALSAQQKMIARTNAIMEAGGRIIDTVSGQLLTQRQTLDKLIASWQDWANVLKQRFINFAIPLQGLEKARKYISDLQKQIEEAEGLQKRGAGRIGLFGFGQPIAKEIASLKKRMALVKSFVDASDANLLNQEKLRLSKIAQREEDERRMVVVKELGELYVTMYNDQEKVARKTSAQIEMLYVQFEKRKLDAATKTQIQIGQLMAQFEKRKLDMINKNIIAIRTRQKQVLSLQTKDLKESLQKWKTYYKEQERLYIEHATKYLDMEANKKDFLSKILSFRKGIEEKGLSDAEKFALARTRVEEAVLRATNASEENRVELFKKATQAQMDFIGKWQNIRREGFDAQPFINVEKEMRELTRLSNAYKLWSEDAIGTQRLLAEETAREFNRADDAIKSTKQELMLVSNEYQKLVKLMQDEKLKTTLDKTQVDTALKTMLDGFLKTKAQMEKPINISVTTTETRHSIPSLKTGTPYVPKIGLALPPKGERAIPVSQSLHNQQQDNRQFTANYYGAQSGSRIEQDFATQQMFLDMQRYDASLTE